MLTKPGTPIALSDLSYANVRQSLTAEFGSALHTAAMTQTRKHIVSVDHAGTYHCVSHCVRRSWLCGFDVYSQTCFEHRKVWVERRIAELSGIFACSVLAYAVMSNHFHLVVSMQPAVARD
jgi:REP element-mobilizing transposase RayT